MDNETAFGKEEEGFFSPQSLEENAEKYNIRLVSFEEVEKLTEKDVEAVSASDITPEFLDLTKRMLKYLVEIGGLGLAGPQLGMKKAFFVYWTDHDDPRVIYNPSYYPDSNAKIYKVEGCLTYTNLRFAVERFKRIRAVWYEYDEKEGLIKRSRSLSGQDAEVFQHETDHCKGKTIAQIGRIYR